MDYQNIDFNKDVVTMYSQLRERMAERFSDSFGPVESSDHCSVRPGLTQTRRFVLRLFSLRSLVTALLKSKSARWVAWSCCCWSMSMSIKNPCSCAQANSIGKTADNVHTNSRLHGLSAIFLTDKQLPALSTERKRN